MTFTHYKSFQEYCPILTPPAQWATFREEIHYMAQIFNVPYLGAVFRKVLLGTKVSQGLENRKAHMDTPEHW
jgi:hypothetical protein